MSNGRRQVLLRRRACIGALLIGVALASVSCSRGGSARPKANFDIGVNTYYAWPGPIRWAPHDMAMLARNDIRLIRQNFRWDQIEPQRGVWHWAYFDEIMEQASVNAINVLPTLEYSPRWASGKSNPANPPTHLGDFASFAEAVVLRYGERGSFWNSHPKLRPEPIDTFEIWNEPWSKVFWSKPDAATYARMVKMSSLAIKSVEPGAKVAASVDAYRENTTARWAPRWISVLIHAFPTMARYVDVGSLHVYQQDYLNPTSTYAPTLKIVRRHLEGVGVRLPLWITETGTSATSISAAGFGDAPRTIVSGGWVVQEQDLTTALDQLNRIAHSFDVQRVYEFSYFRSFSRDVWDPRDKTDSGFYLLGPAGHVRGGGISLFAWTRSHLPK